MQCEQFEATWQRLLDERRSPQNDPHLLAHSLVCQHCAELLESTDALLWGIEQSEPQGLSDDFAQRTVALTSIGSQPTRTAATSPRAIRNPGWWLLAALALGMIAIAQFPALFTPTNLSTPSEIAAKPSSVEPVEPSPGVSEQLSQSEDLQLGSLLAELAERFPKDEATKAITTHIQRLDSATRPLARSVGTAFTAIYRSVGKPANSDKSALLPFRGSDVI